MHHDHFPLCSARLDPTRHPQFLSTNTNTNSNTNTNTNTDTDGRPTDHPAVLDNRLVWTDIALGYTPRVGNAREIQPPRRAPHDPECSPT